MNYFLDKKSKSKDFVCKILYLQLFSESRHEPVEFEVVPVEVSPVLSPATSEIKSKDQYSEESQTEEPFNEPEFEIVREPVQEIIQEPIREPVREIIQEPLKESTSESICDTVSEPEVREPVRESLQEPVRESEPAPAEPLEGSNKTKEQTFDFRMQQNTFGEIKPVFSSKFRTLKVDKFWKKKKPKKVPPPAPVIAATNTAQSTAPPIPLKVTTKAAVKEVNVPLKPSTKTMLAVLKSTKIKSKPGRKKKGKSKPSSSSNNKSNNSSKNEFEIHQYSPGSISTHSKSPAFSPRSVTSSDNLDNDVSDSKKNSNKNKGLKKALIELGWRSKHKNVIDPVFLAELEHLTQDFGTVHLESQMSKDLWPDRPSNSVPSIFRKRKFGPPISSASSSSKNHTISEKSHKRGRPKKVVEKADKVAEQRLPLKKRHLHHAQTQESSDITSETSTCHRRSSTGRSSRKSSTEERRPPRPQNKTNNHHHIADQSQLRNNSAQVTQPPAEILKDKPLPPGSGLSPMKDTNIVDSIAACVDKYTKANSTKPTRPLPSISKDLTQPLTVQTSSCKETLTKTALGSPRKRHLLQMQKPDLAPPTLEKEPEKRPGSVKKVPEDKQVRTIFLITKFLFVLCKMCSWALKFPIYIFGIKKE